MKYIQLWFYKKIQYIERWIINKIYILLDMCEKLDINLKWYGELEAIDKYIEEIYENKV